MQQHPQAHGQQALSSVPSRIPGFLVQDPAHYHQLRSHLAQLCLQTSLRCGGVLAFFHLV